MYFWSSCLIILSKSKVKLIAIINSQLVTNYYSHSYIIVLLLYTSVIEMKKEYDVCKICSNLIAYNIFSWASW